MVDIVLELIHSAFNESEIRKKKPLMRNVQGLFLIYL